MSSQSNTVLPGYKHGCMDCHSAAQTNFYYQQNNPNQPIDFSRQENIIASVRALALQCAHEVNHFLEQMRKIFYYLIAI